MRTVILTLAAIAVMGLGFWAYRENYRTQAELAELRAIQVDVGNLRQSLSMLNAEWAYLNRPDRLRALADINFERLGLLPLTAEQFGTVSQIAFPEPSDGSPDSKAAETATIAALGEGQ